VFDCAGLINLLDYSRKVPGISTNRYATRKPVSLAVEPTSKKVPLIYPVAERCISKRRRQTRLSAIHLGSSLSTDGGLQANLLFPTLYVLFNCNTSIKLSENNHGHLLSASLLLFPP